MKKISLLLLFVIVFSACRNNNDDLENNPIDTQWSIPLINVFDSGVGIDGIPALTNPNMVDINDSEADFLSDTDLVIGYKNGNDVRAYPHRILDWHEVINDNIGNVSVAVTYCPLTGSGIGWNRIVDGNETTFGVSGLLYNNNLIAYDRQTNSNWSQLLNSSVNGSLIGTNADVIPLIETTWKAWKTLYPNSKVVTRNTGFSRNYDMSPYEAYSTNDAILFPVFLDNRLPLKEKVHAISIDNGAKVYQFSSFENKNLIRDVFQGAEFVVVGNSEFIVSFRLEGSTSTLDFEYVYNNSDAILVDNEGNTWNIFGEAIAGPRLGERLSSSNSFMAYWFSVPAFYPTEIYEE